MAGGREDSTLREGVWGIFMWKERKAVELSYLNAEGKLRAQKLFWEKSVKTWSENLWIFFSKRVLKRVAKKKKSAMTYDNFVAMQI